MQKNPNRAVTIYNRPFWLAYVALILTMTGYGLLYRYADFVFFLGGTEFHIGWIVGVGMAGSLAMRLFLGVWIDRYGPRLIWSGSLALMSASCFGHLAISDHAGWPIFFLRVAFACGVAGVWGSGTTFISNRVPNNRMAELVGMFGTAGFAGMMAGAELGDLLYTTAETQRWQVYGMFVGAGASVALAIPFVWLATSGLRIPERRRRPSMFRLLRRYHPGIVILVGVMTGMGMGLPEVFLRTFALTLGISQIALFFTTFATVAILVRLLTRRLVERIGLKPVIFCGLGCMAASMLSFIFVHSHWQLIIPGIGFGVAQAMLMPSVIAATNTGFPTRFRGLGSTLVLAAFDLGTLVGAPAAGLILHFTGKMGLPSYPILFAVFAALVATVGLFYLAVPSRQPSQRRLKQRIRARVDAARPRSSIDLSAPGAYHPAVQFDETPPVDACANAQQTDCE